MEDADSSSKVSSICERDGSNSGLKGKATKGTDGIGGSAATERNFHQLKKQGPYCLSEWGGKCWNVM